MSDRKLVLGLFMIVGLAALMITSFFLEGMKESYLALAVGIVVGLNMSLLQDVGRRREQSVPVVPPISPQPVVQQPAPVQRPQPEIHVPQFEEEVEEEPEDDDRDDELEELRQKLAKLQKERAELEKKPKKKIVRKPKVLLQSKRRKVSSPEMDFPDDLR